MQLPIFLFLALISTSAFGYIGPGAGLGVIGMIVGGVVAIILAFAGVVWYPVKRLLKKNKANPEATELREAGEPEDHMPRDEQSDETTRNGQSA